MIKRNVWILYGFPIHYSRGENLGGKIESKNNNIEKRKSFQIYVDFPGALHTIPLYLLFYF